MVSIFLTDTRLPSTARRATCKQHVCIKQKEHFHISLSSLAVTTPLSLLSFRFFFLMQKKTRRGLFQGVGPPLPIKVVLWRVRAS